MEDRSRWVKVLFAILFRRGWNELLVLGTEWRPVPVKRVQHLGGFTVEFAPVVVLVRADRRR